MWRKKLKSLLSSCLTWVRRLLGMNVIPNKVGGEERVMRTIFHPANFNEKKNSLRSNFIRPPMEVDEDDPTITSNKLSTTRYDYAGIRFCREHARNHQSEPRRHYWGFGRFVTKQLIIPHVIEGKTYTCTVEPKPVEDNPAHANINLGFRLAVGQTIDSQISEYIKQLADSAEILKDPSPESEKWLGPVIDEPMYGSLDYRRN